ncbi:MAG: FHA domain-containing protein [Bacteroidaceae bacterium]|nr:FHA domain-containing protein [Bacteroidaceae bacterium]
MAEIKIKCPKCGKILILSDNPNINNAVFTCPVCKEKHKVGECQRIVDAPKQTIANEETQYGFSSSVSNGEETQFVGASPSQPNTGVLVDNFGRTYNLSFGVNTIGRKATTSSASVQINVEDRYMSRSHAIIEVKNVGGQTLHILRNGAGKNPSYLNGTLIETNDQLILNNGDRIKIGYTELTFKRPL